ncbi:uncharacterized protein LOC120118227 [Hibiscus syriacus]|uniref:uncharacterized protein LOC120118227 n=1 Tax=Hibiscus syriacus TaxID=106335 RepID=UPI001920881C|nr:uncharacterized protein LOC120118227 [Hibiscus syriacus]
MIVNHSRPEEIPKIRLISLSRAIFNVDTESSFSAAGPVTGLRSYSGPMAHSGDLSHRSNSSTTSTRSFAFPTLQSEWNSSPVRMGKADRRQYRKHCGWRHSILCCKFWGKKKEKKFYTIHRLYKFLM